MIDFGSLIELLYQLALAAAFGGLSVLAPFAINWVLEKTKLDKLLGEDLTRNYLNNAFENAIQYGVSQVDAKVAKIDGNIDLGVKNQILEIAVTYVLDAVPDGLERFGINSPEAVRKLVTARLEKLLGTMADPTLVDGQ